MRRRLPSCAVGACGACACACGGASRNWCWRSSAHSPPSAASSAYTNSTPAAVATSSRGARATLQPRHPQLHSEFRHRVRERYVCKMSLNRNRLLLTEVLYSIFSCLHLKLRRVLGNRRKVSKCHLKMYKQSFVSTLFGQLEAVGR